MVKIQEAKSKEFTAYEVRTYHDEFLADFDTEQEAIKYCKSNPEAYEVQAVLYTVDKYGDYEVSEDEPFDVVWTKEYESVNRNRKRKTLR